MTNEKLYDLGHEHATTGQPKNEKLYATEVAYCFGWDHGTQEILGSEFDPGDDCPEHSSPSRKVYTFGSTMSAETEVCTFAGCGCAVAVWSDSVGSGHAKVCSSYDEASGIGRLRAMEAAAKYR